MTSPNMRNLTKMNAIDIESTSFEKLNLSEGEFSTFDFGEEDLNKVAQAALECLTPHTQSRIQLYEKTAISATIHATDTDAFLGLVTDTGFSINLIATKKWGGVCQKRITGKEIGAYENCIAPIVVCILGKIQ
mmetsp:Transcript_6069/g.5685  ORF Transcript_6069/g.5685 Transcript_6069/m.5685 type:complete len:133 (-) Transcript_6069:49-447(-)